MTPAAGVNLVKCLGQTDREKRVSWEKASSVLAEEGVPNSFVTRSRLLIFANTLKSVEENLRSARPRHAFSFVPSPAAVHREVKSWFRDEEIYGFVDRNLSRIQTLSMRDYVKAEERKRAGLDWRGMLLEKWYADPKLAAMIDLVQQDLVRPSDVSRSRRSGSARKRRTNDTSRGPTTS